MVLHIVEAGQTLYSIARQYGVSPERLRTNNGIGPEAQLAVGQCVAVLFPQVTHVVRPGETLYSIADAYGTTVLKLLRNNLFLNGRDLLLPGMVLVIRYERDPLGTYRIGGYAYPFISDDLLTAALPFMTYLMPFTYGINPEEGTLVPLDDERLLLYAGNYGTKAYMHLSTLTENGNFSTEAGTALLADPAIWPTLADNILQTMYDKNYAGLDIDFEFLGAENAERYAEFVAYMRNFLSGYGKQVIVALAPKTRADQPGVHYEGHDYRLLGEAADALLLMTYEWGYTYGPPLPVSPLPSMRRVLDYAVTEIDPSKLFLGISNYGYDFTLPYVAGESRAQSLSTKEAVDLAVRVGAEIQYDETAMAPFFFYTEAGVQHQVYFEDARSIRAKLLLLPEYGLRGALYWNLMRRNEQNLLMLNYYIDILRE